MRARIPNPLRRARDRTRPGNRELVDGEFVTVIVEGVEPIEALAMPRAAVLSDQQGDYVYVVGADNKAEQRERSSWASPRPTRPSSPAACKEGELVIVGRAAARAAGRGGEPGAGDAAAPPPTRAAAPPARRKGWSAPMISRVFVDRPRLAIVIAIIITLAGLIALTRIPVSQFPDIVPPQVQVTTDLSRRVGRSGRIHGRAAAGGAGHRRRQDDLHEVEQRQRRQLQR